MEYSQAGKFLKNKRKQAGFKTQKSFIDALTKQDPEINCSESYISLIESGVKSPALKLLNIMAIVLDLSAQEKGELLLTYKRVPTDFELAVRSNLKDSLKLSNIDLLKKKFEESPDSEILNKLTKALVLDGKTDEAIEILQNSKLSNSNVVGLQDRTAKIAAFSGNYDFAIQAFKLALESCPEEYENTKADILMNIGVCYFSKGLSIDNSKSIDSIEYFLKAIEYLEKSLEIMPEHIFYIDEYARCNYHIADSIQYFQKNKLDFKIDKNIHTKIYEKFKLEKISYKKTSQVSEEHFKVALQYYKKIISHIERGDLPENHLKISIYFHAYTYCKLKMFEEGLVWLNSISILDPNWLTHFMKAGYWIIRYEEEKKEDYLDYSLQNLLLAYDFSPESIKDVLKTEKDRELKTLWDLKSKDLQAMLENNDES